MRGIRLRRSFPGDNPQKIRCPQCGGPAETSPDGIIYTCPENHFGYYEQPADVIIPDDKWRPDKEASSGK